MQRHSLVPLALLALLAGQRAVASPAPTSSDPAGLSANLVDVAEAAVLGVVHIAVESRAPAFEPGMGMPFFFFGPPSPPQPREGLGSGIVLDANGLILTNHHVIEDAQRIEVTLHDGRTFPARVLGSDEPTDLALLQLEGQPTGLHPLPLAVDRPARLGEVVLAIGNPFGLDGSVSMGIVSAVGRAGMGIVDHEEFIQTDAAINPGNSGGALVALDGRVLGVNTAIQSTNGGSLGIGFAVPASLAQDIVDRLKADGRVRRSWLGVGVQDVTAEAARALGLSVGSGALINQVEPGTPAARGGVRVGDVIVLANGRPVRDAAALRRIVSLAPAGEKSTFDLIRDGKPLSLTLALDPVPDAALAARPERPTSSAQSPGALGATTQAVTPDEAKRFGLPAGASALVITGVAPGSRAAVAGLRPGDLLLEADRQPLRSREQLDAAAQDGALLLVQRGDRSSFVWLAEPTKP
jgi:Do/DeqQ family serine protease